MEVKKILILIIIVFFYASVGTCENINNGIDKEVFQVALKWKEAILKKDINLIASFALPEDREATINDLKNTTSFLHCLFFDNKKMMSHGGKSVYTILKNSKQLNIVIVNHNLEGYGNGVSAYYYDLNTLNVKFPIDPSEEQSLLNKGIIWKTFFFQVDSIWYTSYNY